MKRKLASNPEILDWVVEVIIAQARSGDPTMIKYLWDRLDGTPVKAEVVASMVDDGTDQSETAGDSAEDERRKAYLIANAMRLSKDDNVSANKAAVREHNE